MLATKVFWTSRLWIFFFFLRGHIKEQVYKDNISSTAHSKQKITEEFEKLENDISLHSVQISLIRLQTYVRSNEDIFNNTRNSVLCCSVAIGM